MQKSCANHESQRRLLLTLDWAAVALSVVVLLAPVTSVFQTLGGSEIVDVEQEECSVEKAEARREQRHCHAPPTSSIAKSSSASNFIISGAQVCSRTSERDFLNGTGGWLRL